jgi:hypothetical protein
MANARSLAVVAALFVALQLSSGYLYPTYGAVGGLTPSCLTSLNDIFNGKYLLNSVAPSQDTRYVLPKFLLKGSLDGNSVVLAVIHSSQS